MKFSKEHIIDEIRRTAKENGGKPLGKTLFLKETGIRESDWCGKFWARWGEAVTEAGFEPNTLQIPYKAEFIVSKLASLIKELGHYPTNPEIRMKARADKGFPHGNTFKRIGNKFTLISKVIEYCRKQREFDDVIKICESIAVPLDKKDQVAIREEIKEEVLGYVYMTKITLGKEARYKIGSSAAPFQRTKQLNTRSPVEEILIHEIGTNDPERSEKQYWHKKFSEKREPRTEYFNLRGIDIQQFKKYKTMMWQLIFTPPN